MIDKYICIKVKVFKYGIVIKLNIYINIRLIGEVDVLKVLLNLLICVLGFLILKILFTNNSL